MYEIEIGKIAPRYREVYIRAVYRPANFATVPFIPFFPIRSPASPSQPTPLFSQDPSGGGSFIPFQDDWPYLPSIREVGQHGVSSKPSRAFSLGKRPYDP
jgi:hypothetical protein